MAEILLRKRKHFAEDAKPAEWSDLKWAGRPQRGDVVDVRPNGFYEIWAIDQAGRGWDRDAFMLVKLTNVNVSTLPSRRGWTDETHTTPYKNRYRLNVWANVPWVKTTRTLPDGRTFEEWFYQRATGGSVVPLVDRMA